MDKHVDSLMERLPDEILLMIFRNIGGQHLMTNVAKVCRRWERLISYLVLKIQYPGNENRIHNGLMALLITCYVPGFFQIHTIISDAAMIKNLKELTISISYCFDDDDVNSLVFLKNLRHLDIFMKKNFLDHGTHIPLCVTSLVVNNTMDASFVTAMALSDRVINSFHMYGRAIHYPCRWMIHFLNIHSGHLTDLTLRCPELPPLGYEAIGQCENLTSLELHCCWMLTPIAAMNLTKLTELRRLHLSGMRMVRPNYMFRFLEALPEHIKELTLDYSCFGDEHFRTLVARLPDLHFLELWRTDIRSSCLVQLASMLKSLTDLDTDVIFSPEEIQTLNTHPSLERLRCRWIGPINPRFHIFSADEMIPYQYLREDDQGPRASLFYYWLQESRVTRAPPAPYTRPEGPTLTNTNEEVCDWPLYMNYPIMRRN